MVCRFSICIRVWVQRRKADWFLIEGPKCGYNWIQYGRGVQPCDLSDQLPHLVREVNDAVKFEIVGVTSNDEMNVIIVLCTDDIESMADVVEEESFLLGVWFGIETAQCDSFDFYVVCDIFLGI